MGRHAACLAAHLRVGRYDPAGEDETRRWVGWEYFLGKPTPKVTLSCCHQGLFCNCLGVLPSNLCRRRRTDVGSMCLGHHAFRHEPSEVLPQGRRGASREEAS